MSSRRRAMGAVAAIWCVRSFASCRNSGVLATKSVSQFTSTSTPTRPLWCTYASINPSDASRPARLSALAAPCLRSRSMACSSSPPVAASARLQSIIPAPVRARSSATSFAGISFTVATLLTPHNNAALAPCGSEGGGWWCHGGSPGWSAVAPAARFRRRRCRRGRLLRLEPGGDRLGLRPPLAPRRLLLPLAFRLGLHARLRRIRHRLAFLGDLAQRHLVPRLGDHVGDRGGDQRDRADRIVVAGDRNSDEVRVGVGVHDRHDRNAQLVRLSDRDPLLLRIHHEQRAREPGHVLDAREVLLQLPSLALEEQLLLLRVMLELAFANPLLEVLQPLDLPLDRLEVRERAAQPALGHPERPAALRLGLDDVLELLLRADEEGPLTLQYHPSDQLLRSLDLAERLLQINDVDPRALGKDEPPHLRVPAACLVAEMDARF